MNETLGLRLEGDASSLAAALRQATAEFGRAEAAGRKLADLKWSDISTGLNQAFEAVSKVAGKTVELAKFSAEMRNLEARVPVERLRMMQEATEGAVGKTDLMRFSMRAMSGEMRLTEAGLETVLRAANTLGDKGFGDTSENAEKLLSALRKGSSKELREFGVALTDTGDKQKNVNQLMQEFRRLAEEDAPVNETLKQIELAQTKFADFIVDVKAGLGDLVNGLLLAILKISGLIDDTRGERITQRARSAAGEMTASSVVGDVAQMGFAGRLSAGYLQVGAGLGGAAEAQATLDYTARHAVALQHAIKVDQIEAAYAKAFQDAKDEITRARLAKDKGYSGRIAGDGRGGGKRTLELERQFGTVYRGGPEQFVDASVAAAIRGAGGEALGGFGEGAGWAAGAPAMADAASAFFEGTATGGADAHMAELRRQLEDQTTAIGGSFAALSAGLTASVEAAISGSENIGKAALRASAMALRGIALEAGAKALFATAEGIFGLNPKGFAAAGAYALAAAVAGGSAALLGSAAGGGGGGSVRAGGSPYAAPGGGFGPARASQAQAGPTVTNIYFQGPANGATYREAGEVMSKALDTGRRAGRVRGEHTLTVRHE